MKNRPYLKNILIQAFTLFACLCMPVALQAELDIDGPQVAKSIVPVVSKTAVFSFTASDTSDSTTNKLEKIYLYSEDIGGRFGFNSSGYTRVYIYEDRNETNDGQDGQFDEDIDVSVGSTAVSGTNSTVEIEITGAQTITSDNASEGINYFVVVDLDDDNQDILGVQSNIAITQITATDGSSVFTAVDNDITAAGIKLTYDEDLGGKIVPSHVFPSQKVAMMYVLVEAKGEDVDNASMLITSDENIFVESTGVEEVALYYSSATQKNQNVTFNSSEESEDPYSYELRSVEMDEIATNSVTISGWNAQSENPVDFDLDMDDPVGLWIVYTMGRKLNVSEDAKIEAELVRISGTGQTSGLLVSTKLDDQSSDTEVAGVTIEEVTDITTSDTFGKNTYAQMLSFKLRSYVASSNVAQINILNENGTVGFATGQSEASSDYDVIKLELYEDGGDEEFSITGDTLVGVADLKTNYGNTGTHVEVQTDISLGIYDEFAATRLDTNEKMVFLVYYFGSDITDSESASGNIVSAEIGRLIATANFDFFSSTQTETFDSPSSSDSDPLEPSSGPATVSLENIELSVITTNSVIPNTLFEGEQDVPVLAVQLRAGELLSGLSFEIDNSGSTFYGDARGVTRVSIYKDDGDESFDINEDSLLASKSTFEESDTVTIDNIEVPSGITTIFICYSLGQETYSRITDGDETIRAQLAGISSSESVLQVAGNFPFPSFPSLVEPMPKLVDSINLSSLTDESQIISTDPFSITLEVENDSPTYDLKVLSLKPKVYRNSKSGLDITHEFSITTSNAMLSPTIDKKVGVNPNAKSNSFSIYHSIPYTEGSAVVDARLEYTVGDSNPIIYSRYEDEPGSWFSAVGDSSLISFEITEDMVSDEILPAYIQDPVQVYRIGDYYDFRNGSAVEAGDIMSVTFLTPDAIDDSTITIVRGNVTLVRSSSLSESEPNRYTYVNGVIEFYVGSSDADVRINVDDINGNALEQATISYLISSEIELTQPLFFPSPYQMGSGDLSLGFSITKASHVTIYVYNYLGNQVFTDTEYFSTVGYNVFTIPSSSSFLVPGVYVVFIKAVRPDGEVSVMSTKLGIY